MYKQEGKQLSTWADSGRRKGNGFKLKEGRFRTDVRGGNHLSGGSEALAQLRREAVGAPSMEVLKARLDGPWAAELGGRQP